MNQPVPRTTTALDVVELRIPRKAEWVAVARLAVAAVANRLEFSIEDIEDVKLAVAEACTNCIQNAGGSDHIEIVCETGPDGLRMSVRDTGRSARPERVAPRAVDDSRVGGLGIFLIRSLMDSVEYDVDPEHGTRLVMTKKARG